MPEISAERLDELESAEKWFEYLLWELEDYADSLDEYVHIDDVFTELRELTQRMRNGGAPE